MKYIILILLFSANVYAQSEVAVSHVIAHEITLDGLAADDSLGIDSIGFGCQVSKVIVYVDTVLSGVTAMTVRLRENAATLITYNVGGEAVAGYAATDRPDATTGAASDVVVFSWTGSGTGRIRVFVFYDTLY